MRTVTPLDLRRSLGAILDSASAGERILIERDHRPLAYLVSVEEGRRLDPDIEALLARRMAALDRLAALGERMRVKYPPPDDGLTDAEWLRQEHDRRADQINRAAASRWDEE